MVVQCGLKIISTSKGCLSFSLKNCILFLFVSDSPLKTLHFLNSLEEYGHITKFLSEMCMEVVGETLRTVLWRELTALEGVLLHPLPVPYGLECSGTF